MWRRGLTGEYAVAECRDTAAIITQHRFNVADSSFKCLEGVLIFLIEMEGYQDYAQLMTLPAPTTDSLQIWYRIKLSFNENMKIQVSVPLDFKNYNFQITV